MADYRTVVVDNLPDAPNPTRRKKEVDEAVGATAFGFNVYVADPGERVPWGYHRHPEHEELFYVLDGRLSVETADGRQTVEAGEAFFVPRDAPNKAVATGDRPARFVAVGAPKTTDRAVISEPCRSCGETTDRESREDDGAVVLTCAACDAETDRFEPGPSG